MIAIPWIIGRLADLWWYLWELYLAIWDIPLIGDPLGWIIIKLQDSIGSLISDLWEFNAWATDVGIAIRDILSWDAILDKIILTLFGGKHPWDWFWDMIWYWLDLYFPWLRDPEFTFRGFIEGWLRTYIPWVFTIDDKIRDAFWGFIDIYFPWLRDPEFTIWGWLEPRVRELIPVEIPTFEDIVEWISEKMGDIMARFLAVASWPFLAVLEAFILRMWDEEAEEG